MKKLSKLIVYVALALSPMLLSRCTLSEDLSKLKTSLDSVKVVIGTPDFSNAIHIDFNDAGTNSTITGDIKVKLTGVGAARVYNNLGEHFTEYTIKNGMLDLIVDPNLDSLSLLNTPLRFNITTTPVLPGYLSQTQQVQVSHEKLKLVQVSLVNLNPSSSQDKVQGISVSSQNNLTTANNTQGTTTSSSQQVDQTSNTTIVVPVGSVLKNASGNSLSGQVNSQVVFFSGSDTKTQEIIADQLTGSVKLDNNNKPNDSIQTKLISAGMYTAQITVGNETVKKFDGAGLKLKTELADTLYNPEKGRMIQVGDIIPMWSKEEGTGTWILEKNSVVTRDQISGKLYLEDVVNHLSTWNWDWYCASAGTSLNYCDNGPRINWKLVDFQSAYVTASVVLNSKYAPYSPLNEYITNGNYTQFARTPKGLPGKITFAEKNPVAGRTLTFSPPAISFQDLCSLGSQNVTVTATFTGIVNVKFNLSAQSADPSSSVTIKPTLYIYYRPVGQSYWNYMYLNSGIANLTLKTGKKYDLRATVGANTGFGTLQIDELGANQYKISIIPIDANSSTLGNQIPPINVTATNNTIEVLYKAILPKSTFDQLNKVARKR